MICYVRVEAEAVVLTRNDRSHHHRDPEEERPRQARRQLLLSVERYDRDIINMR